MRISPIILYGNNESLDPSTFWFILHGWFRWTTHEFLGLFLLDGGFEIFCRFFNGSAEFWDTLIGSSWKKRAKLLQFNSRWIHAIYGYGLPAASTGGTFGSLVLGFACTEAFSRVEKDEWYWSIQIDVNTILEHNVCFTTLLQQGELLLAAAHQGLFVLCLPLEVEGCKEKLMGIKDHCMTKFNKHPQDHVIHVAYTII